MSKDYYNILGVSKTATKDEIKKAFRTKAHEYHPDKSSGDEAKFKEINEAYQVLGDEQKRQQYDQFGSNFDQQGGFGGGMNWDDFMRQARQGGGGYQNVHVDFGDLGDIFGDIFGGGFGGGRARKPSTRGNDLEIALNLDFKEAIFGVKKEVELHKLDPCSACSGTGAEKDSKITTCQKCQGQGQVRTVKQTMLGAMQSVSVCPDCRGEGKTIEKKCHECQGEGRKKEISKVGIAIPAGVENGMTIKLSGYGDAGVRGGTTGDLYVHIRVKESPDFKRDGATIYTKQTIPYSLAALGGKTEVETVNGPVTLKIPAGTQNNKIFKLKGKGAPHFQRGGTGDHLVEMIIEVPDSLSRSQKKLLHDLEEEGL